MSDDAPKPREVAVLGGGIGALTVALALSDAERRARYNVTIYQLGWRLGGKGASGRNAQYGQRIEEHGIHVWFGFYENAFKLLSSCYDALAESGWSTPDGKPVALQRCIESGPGRGGAFYPHHDYVVNEYLAAENRFCQWPLAIPANDLAPGDGAPTPPEKSLAFAKLTAMLASISEVRESRPVDAEERFEASSEDSEERKFREIVEARSDGLEHTVQPEEYLQRALDGLASPGLDDLLAESFAEALLSPENSFRLRLKFMAWSLRQASRGLKHWSASAKSERLHRLCLSADVFAAVATGLSRDVFSGDQPEASLDALDALDLREWLLKHGADRDTIRDNPVVRFVYNSAFAFEDGEPARPRIGTGSALRGIIRLFLNYKGAFAYRMASGMGDVVFSPIHELLRARGVKFKFFHRVDRLLVRDVDGRAQVSEVVLTEQARTIGESYDPFVWVKDFPSWPSEPRYTELVDGQRIATAVREGKLNFEDPSSSWGGESELRLHLGRDFDEVVLGIPIGALGPITQDLARHPRAGARWSAMLENVRTTPTQAYQLWLRGSLRDLGWDHPPAVFGTYQDPIDTYIDMTPALELEERRTDDVKNLSYFCGVFPRIAGESHADSMSRAIDNAVQHLTELCPYIFPSLRHGDGFQWRLLWNGQHGATDRDRFLAGQYARANVLPSELYTLTLPGSTGYRLPPDLARTDPGFCQNLWLAGDWTRNPLNLGCIEATVMSGLQAARGLSDDPIEIIGEDDAFAWASLGRGTRPLSGSESLASSPGAPLTPASPAAGPSPPAAVVHSQPWGDVVASLREAASSYDQERVGEICELLLERLPVDASAPAPSTAEQLLSVLRQNRYFGWLGRVADALTLSGRTEPAVWRLYAQALIEQGHQTAALAVLERLIVDGTTPEHELVEALGLRGRVHKQRFVQASGGPRAAAELQRSLAAYSRGYEISRGGWHAVNLVALLRRAERDRIAVPAGLDARTIAQEAIDAVRQKRYADIDVWDRAILVEAAVALDDWPAARVALSQHLAGSTEEPSAFAIASMLRQFREIWQLRGAGGPETELLTLLEGALLQRQGGRLELTPQDLSRGNANLQRVLGRDQAQTLGWYRTGLERCRLVACILGPHEAPVGTGFLVRAGDFLPGSPHAGELVLLTNEHVLSSEPRSGALRAESANVRFEAASAGASPTNYRVLEILWSSTALDATIARLDGTPQGLEPYPFATDYPPRDSRERMVVIGHAGGRTLSISLNDNLMIDWEDPKVHYRAPTEPGSSGSPVFDREWRLIALHHAGGLLMPRLNGQAGVYRANEGIWINAIRRAAQMA